MKKLKLTFISDSGHGWLGVPMDVYVESGIQASRFSYESKKTKTVWLEEDCDAPKFLSAVRGEMDLEIEEKSVNGDAFIRSLPRIGGSK